MSVQDDGNDTLRTAILYRDQKTGTAMIHPFDPRQIDDDDIQNFFKLYKCYDILHQNTKMVSLDTRHILKLSTLCPLHVGWGYVLSTNQIT